MLNQVVLVGRIKMININELVISVSRNFKNENGEYEDDDIKVYVAISIQNNINEYCKIGDIIGIKGRIERNNRIVAEKVTFLSSKKESE